MEQIFLADVAVEKAGTTFDKLFTYKVPSILQPTLKPGCRVLVPFGNGNRKQQALVFRIYRYENNMAMELFAKLKPILDIIDATPVVDDEMFQIIDFLKETTFCTYYDAIKALLPPGINVSVVPKYALCEDFDAVKTNGLNREEQNLVGALRHATTRLEIDKILTRGMTPSKRAAVSGLVQKGIVSEQATIKRAVGQSVQKMVRRTPTFDMGKIRLNPNQARVCELLEQTDAAEWKEVCYLCGVSDAVLRNLVKKGAIEQYDKVVWRTPYEALLPQTDPSAIELTPEQQAVFEGIDARCRENTPGVALLHGITGSGKTHVFLKLIHHVRQSGKQALMLVPEIALTPQMMQTFRAMFGQSVAVLHSGLSLGERLDEWQRIKCGQADIVVGTRSAVFAPLKKIGLIIMDEEGEWSYKSESAPRYHARDVAKLRCVYHDAVLLLASATPSMESYYKAKQGKYHLFELKHRYADAALPQVHLVDLRTNTRRGSVLSDVLVDEIYYNLQRGEQVILLLNRRGYHTYAACMDCGEPVVCPNCSVALTHHKANGRMMCHYCGYSQPLQQHCAVCESAHIKLTGQGTQRLEDELEGLFPDAKILRMDTDTTFSRASYEQKFAAFANHEYDIMVGTQMIAKGLNFPDVTLVGVLNADSALYATDFRSAERTFSLITQVVGRGGRFDKPGRAYIQTYDPDNVVINLAAKQEYEAFYQDEIQARKALLYPPFCDICTLWIQGDDEQKTKRAATHVVELMRRIIRQTQDVPMRVLGPVAAHVVKVNNKYRYRIVIKCKANNKFRAFIRKVMKAFSDLREFAGVAVYVDVNGE